MTTQPLIDRNSPKPPSADQLIDWQVEFRRQFREAAKARGLEGEIGAVIGTVDGDPDLIEVNIGFPKKGPRGNLHRGSAMRGDRADMPGDLREWTVQGNDLIQLWEGGEDTGFHGLSICANVIRLVRTDPTIEGSTLPTTPEGFSGEPFDLEGLEINPTALSNQHLWGVAQYLLGIACSWGDWSAIPWSEFVSGFEETDLRDGIANVRALEELGFIEIDGDHDKEERVHFRPAFANIFLRPAA